MSASERSLIGFAKETVAGTEITTDASFTAMMVTRGSAGVNSNVVPLDMEVGGGAVQRDLIKAGVVAGGGYEFIPRPNSLGLLLMGLLGKDTLTGDGAATPYTHALTLDNTDPFSQPTYTVRWAPGRALGEVFVGCKISSVGLSWRAANFVRGSFAFTGLDKATASAEDYVAAWGTGASVDTTPPFITPTASIEVPSGTALKVLAGSFQMSSAMPLDQQWIVGSPRPDGLDTVQKAFMLNLTVKVTDKTLYNKLMYDGAGGAAGWTSNIFKSSNVDINFKGAQTFLVGAVPTDYKLSITGNGSVTDALGNIIWSGTPVAIRAGQQIIMNVSGLFVADATQAIKLTLQNTHSTAY